MAISVQVDIQTQPAGPRTQEPCPALTRAMALWPRLDRRALARNGCDPARIARRISRRTGMPEQAIETLLSRS
jgi:hypothetical protein